MSCKYCQSTVDVSDEDGPYVIRTCAHCGRKMKVRELAKHGLGINIRAGDAPVIPASFLSVSANPLKSRGQLYRPGLAWFIDLVFAADILNQKDAFTAYAEKQLEQFDQF